jgi:hypothetical protein
VRGARAADRRAHASASGGRVKIGMGCDWGQAEGTRPVLLVRGWRAVHARPRRRELCA